ncbi:unnamed protein product, partial [Mesorhabditis spiculigera]
MAVEVKRAKSLTAQVDTSIATSKTVTERLEAARTKLNTARALAAEASSQYWLTTKTTRAAYRTLEDENGVSPYAGHSAAPIRPQGYGLMETGRAFRGKPHDHAPECVCHGCMQAADLNTQLCLTEIASARRAVRAAESELRQTLDDTHKLDIDANQDVKYSQSEAKFWCSRLEEADPKLYAQKVPSSTSKPDAHPTAQVAAEENAAEQRKLDKCCWCLEEKTTTDTLGAPICVSCRDALTKAVPKVAAGYVCKKPTRCQGKYLCPDCRVLKAFNLGLRIKINKARKQTTFAGHK